MFDPLYRNRKPFFNIMSGLSHIPDQIYHLWKLTLSGPKIILRSILVNSQISNSYIWKAYKCLQNSVRSTLLNQLL